MNSVFFDTRKTLFIILVRCNQTDDAFGGSELIRYLFSIQLLLAALCFGSCRDIYIYIYEYFLKLVCFLKYTKNLKKIICSWICYIEFRT
jgi:hypothetical protein